MKPFLISVFFAVGLWGTVDAIAQRSAITFRHLSIDDGLSQNAVFAILQDQQGFMWLGTKDGLNRYDGYSFRIFQNDPFDSTSLSSSYVTTLFEDSRGLLWIGTRNGGVNRLDRNTETFIRFIHNPENPNSLSSNEITAIAEDFDGNLWIGTRGGGINKLSKSDLSNPDASVVRYLHDSSDPNSLSHNIVNALLFDRGGIAWIGTDAGLDELVERAGKVSFTHYPILTKNPKAPSSPKDNIVTAIHEDSRGAMWLGTPSGLSRFDRNSGKLLNYPHHYEVYRYGWGTVTDILEDRAGYFWLATPGELMRFDPVSQTYLYFRHDPLDPFSISDNSTASLFQDRSGVLWFGTAGYGLNLYDPKSDRFKTLRREKDAHSRIAGFSVRSILEDNEGNLWVSTGVLYKWNRKTGELKSFETSSEQLDVFGNTGAWSMIQDRRGMMWLATHQGLYRYEPRTGLTRQYKFNPADTSGLREKIVHAVFEDRNGDIWLATDSYLSRLINEETGRFIHYRYNFDSPDPDPAYPTIFQDSRGQLWLGTRNGLLRFEPETKSFIVYKNNPKVPNSLSNNVVRSICADPNQPGRILWLGTHGGGLNRFDMKTGTFTHITTKDGLPNNVVYGILPDDQGRLWMSTNKGLSRFDPQSGEIKNYDVSNGLQSNEFNSGAYYKSKSGELFFGGINGLNYFYPGQLSDNPHVPNVVFTGFRIFNQEVSPGGRKSPLLNVISQTREMTLSYKDVVITFEFAALDFSAPFRNQYAYKMEGFNDDWIQAGAVRNATYTNLPPGDYVFRVIGSNNDGVWNKEGAQLIIHITPPSWKTWWAFALYGVLFLALIYGIRRYELNRVRLKNRLELERIQGEKLRDLDQTKSRFFANISHEFRTPLTLILGQVDRVLGSTKDRVEKNRLEIALRNARRLLHLINQLLDLSKIEAGSMQLKGLPVNMVLLLKNVIYSFESLAEKKNIALHFHCQPDHLTVICERDKLENVFYNLLSNAFKFTPDGGTVEVRIDTSLSPIPGREIGANNSDASAPERAEIRISDSGHGIPPKQLPYVFDRFYQVDHSLTREQMGSGIGLALVKEIVELHGGEVNVTSEEEKGTTFTVCLPIVASDIETETPASHVEKSASEQNNYQEIPLLNESEEILEPDNGEHPGPKDGTETPIILVVEDNADVRAYIRDQLELSHMVLEADNGENGIAMAREKIPDLIITDVMMPKMNGYDLSRILKNDEKTCHIPIIMLTAKAELQDKIEGLETGADAYLIKPFDAKELTVRVRTLINSRRRLRERFREVTIVKPEEVTVVPIDLAFLKKVLSTVEQNMGDDQFNAGVLADSVSMSISQLNRKLRALIDQPAGQLIRSVRLRRAADLLKQNAGNIAEVCYQVGFGDQATFTRAFKKHFGFTPSEFKKSS
jgi:signal transduction histidine kinase/ligand-binding sensor domain-containing protein/DNA-binding response OmpR family regulator